MLIKLLLLGGAAAAVVYGVKDLGAKKFNLSLSNIDWINKRFDYELTINGKFEASEKNISMNSGSNGSAGKSLETIIIRDQAANAIQIKVLYNKRQVAGKIVDFKAQMTMTFSPGV